MAIDTAAFLAGVGLLVTLDLFVLGVSVNNARIVGEDEQARERAQEAEEVAEGAHDRIDFHLRREHDKDPEKTA